MREEFVALEEVWYDRSLAGNLKSFTLEEQ